MCLFMWKQYACRKTLADNRPRVRGSFARNDEPNEIPKAPCLIRDEDEVDFWVIISLLLLICLLLSTISTSMNSMSNIVTTWF
jgi:hypothetical protein